MLTYHFLIVVILLVLQVYSLCKQIKHYHYKPLNDLYYIPIQVCNYFKLIFVRKIQDLDQNICFSIKKSWKHRLTDDFQKFLSGGGIMLKTTYCFFKSSCELLLTLWSLCLEVKFSFTRKVLKFISLHQAVSM